MPLTCGNTRSTSARRGELCGLRWRNLDLATGAITVRTSIAQDGSRRWEKDTKTHQQRRVAVDADTVKVLTAHRVRCAERADALGLELDASAFAFSLSPDGSTHLVPSSVSQRYRNLAKRLNLDTQLHQLRHYSATELICRWRGCAHRRGPTGSLGRRDDHTAGVRGLERGSRPASGRIARRTPSHLVTSRRGRTKGETPQPVRTHRGGAPSSDRERRIATG